MTTVRTVTGTATVEIDRVRGSRFIGDLAPATDEAAARAFVASIRAREPDATHHCWGFRLADGRERSSDDGEPGGTAGAPILRHLAGAEIADAVLVVTRYYGGTNLGRGGLARAYGAAAAAVLADAPTVVRPVTSTLRLRHDYGMSAAVQAVLAAHDATVVDSDYGTEVELRVRLPVAAVDGFRAALTEATAGRVVAHPS